MNALIDKNKIKTKNKETNNFESLQNAITYHSLVWKIYVTDIGLSLYRRNNVNTNLTYSASAKSTEICVCL